MGGAGLTSSMSHWIDFPVKDMRSWKAVYEERFQPVCRGRVPDDWEKGKSEFMEKSGEAMFRPGKEKTGEAMLRPYKNCDCRCESFCLNSLIA